MSDATLIEETTAFEFPTPKFSKGQTVYYPAVESERVTDGCPDCLGKAIWKVTTPAGTEFEIKCPRCAQIYGDIPAYYRTTFTAKVKAFPIDNMKFETHAWQPGGTYGPLVTYMGRGHGEMREGNLYATEAEALAAAENQCAGKQAEFEAREDEREHSRIAGYQIREALTADADKRRRKADLKYETLLDAIKELKDEYISDFWRVCKGDTSDTAVKVAIGRHLLEKANEDVPEEWEGW